MAAILCVWTADLPETSVQYYEDKVIPDLQSRHSDSVLLGEAIGTPLDEELEGSETRDAAFTSLAVYETEDAQKIIDAICNESTHPVKDGPLSATRFEFRSYELLNSWQSDETWNGDAADVSSLLLWEWQPHAGFEEEAAEYYQSKMGPLFSQAPENLRVRFYKVKKGSSLNGDSYSAMKDEDLHAYMCLVDMNCEDWPWGEVFAINELPGWGMYFENQRRVKWEISQYVVTRSYPDEVIEKRNG